MPIERRGRSLFSRCSPKRLLRLAGAAYTLLLLCLAYRQWKFGQIRTQDSHPVDSAPPRTYDYNPLRKLFYIHPLGPELVDVWPTAYTHARLSTNATFKVNFGAGELLDAREGRYRTHQYSLFRIFYHRLLESPYRTDDPGAAALFFIPYDIGMDASTRSSDGALARTDCPRLDAVLTSLLRDRHFRRKGGSDYFMLHSINHMMLHFLPRRTCRRMYELCFNCTKLSIDVYGPSVYRELGGERNPLMHRWHSVPFPSDYHYSSAASAPPWDEPYQRRPFALAFVGSTQVSARYQRELREAIVDHCRLLRESCLLKRLTSHDSLSATAPQYYRQARLCLMPGGDFPARKAFFDALLSGCVPVLFHRWSAHEQWLWSWGGPAAAEAALLFEDGQQLLLEPQRVFSRLLATSANETLMRNKLAAIRAVAHRMQYSLPSGGRGPNDAVDVALEHLFMGSDVAAAV